jgi:hypothetical protein
LDDAGKFTVRKVTPEPAAPGQNIERADWNGYVTSISMSLPAPLLGAGGQTELFAFVPMQLVAGAQDTVPPGEVNVTFKLFDSRPGEESNTF